MHPMKTARAALAFFLLALSLAASATPAMPRFDELKERLKIRPEQELQYDLAVGATKRALLAVGLSAMEMKQRLAEELMKANPDFSRLFDGADRLFDQHRPQFEEAAHEWKKLYALLDDRQVEVVKRFLLDNLGALGAAPFLDDPPRKKEKTKPPVEEWI
jgi:hypothetical protein